ncbi:MAG TPA: hypothetical protein VFK03_00035 [Candidatus Saccharimonadales bacterium]|nr:hypothetical protein [Candidatus Saccharimonadales bacterium]
MSENLGQDPEQAEQFNAERALGGVVDNYFPEDAEFLGEMDFEDRLNTVYRQLLELGEDPEVVLAEAGVLESNDEV